MFARSVVTKIFLEISSLLSELYWAANISTIEPTDKRLHIIY